MTETDTYIQKLVESNPLREPILRNAIQALHLPSGSRGLDAGCGVGLQASLLAEAVGSTGHVTGLDMSQEFLLYAEKILKRSELVKQIFFREGNVNELPFDKDTFDWVWSSDCVGYPVGDLFTSLRELMRVVKPGGTVAILAWSSQQLLPGYPLLEARLNATCSSYVPIVKGKRPEDHFLRALGGFRKAGFMNPTARTFIGDVQAPLGHEIRTALISLFQMLWGDPQPGVSQDDWREYNRLCDPESPDFILDLYDYYAFFTYTLFFGKVP